MQKLTCMPLFRSQVGSAVAQCAAPIMAAGKSLQIACALLHILGGVIAYALCKPIYDEKTCRTFAIETSMKSSAFGFLLAKYAHALHGHHAPPWPTPLCALCERRGLCLRGHITQCICHFGAWQAPLCRLPRPRTIRRLGGVDGTRRLIACRRHARVAF